MHGASVFAIWKDDVMGRQYLSLMLPSQRRSCLHLFESVSLATSRPCRLRLIDSGNRLQGEPPHP